VGWCAYEYLAGTALVAKVVRTMKKKKLTVDVERLFYVVAAVAGFFGLAGTAVLDWDLIAVPLFHATAAPFTAGLGLSLLVTVLVAIVEVLRDRK
jgi:hypothetical protein